MRVVDIRGKAKGTTTIKVSDALDANFIYAGDLDGRDVVLTIDRVADKGTVKREGGGKIDKEVAYFKESKRGLVLCKTNLRRIQLTHGNDMARWPGKKITLYPTTTDIAMSMAVEAGCAILGVKGKKATVPCIRVKVLAGIFDPVPLPTPDDPRHSGGEIEW